MELLLHKWAAIPGGPLFLEQINYLSFMLNDSNSPQIISYMTLRTMIGILGFGLPPLLYLVNGLVNHQWTLENSISDYYDNAAAGSIFVGVLYVLGFFLFAYKGPDRIDDRIADWGAVFALGVAMCPTMSKLKSIYILHFLFAMALFSVFIYFSLVLFRKTGSGTPTRQKVQRNWVYLCCGWVMIVCIATLALGLWLFPQWLFRYQLIFWLEATALSAFGFSWLVKGGVLLKDIT